MSHLSGYDKWKTTPPDEGPDGDACPECEGAGYLADEDGRWTCPVCHGERVVPHEDDDAPNGHPAYSEEE